jgi:hypothetical protein
MAEGWDKGNASRSQVHLMRLKVERFTLAVGRVTPMVVNRWCSNDFGGDFSFDEGITYLFALGSTPSLRTNSLTKN